MADDSPTPGQQVVLTKGFAPQDGLRFDRGLSGLVVAVDHDRPDGCPYQVVFLREGHLGGDNAWLRADDLTIQQVS